MTVAMAAVLAMVIGSLISCAETKASEKKVSPTAGPQVEELEQSMSYEEYQKRYKEVFGTATEQMAEEGNPAELVLEDGIDLVNTAAGPKGLSCASCHGKDGVKLKGVAATYPKYNPAIKGIATVALQINRCREGNMGAEPFKYESYDQLAITMYVKSLANGVPVRVSIDGPARPFYDKGKVYYFQRQGQFNFSCAVCHVKYAGYMARTNLISNNKHHGDHWPAYRLKWGKTGSMQRRFRGCLKNMRAKRPAFQSEIFRDLELYLTSIANGEPVQVPGLRM